MIRKTPRVINSVLPRKETRLYEYPLTDLNSSDIVIEFLYDYLYISEEQFKLVKQSSIDNNISLVEATKKELGITDEELIIMLSSIYGIETFDFEGYTVPQEALSTVNGLIAESLCIMPVCKNGDILTIAISDPSDLNLLDGINKEFGCVDIVLTTKKQIREALRKNYSYNLSF